MKTSLALGPSQPVSRQTAWGCLTANLALPGSGSLAAGRRSGYPQLALAAIGLILTCVFGVRFILWSVANWSQLYGSQADPFTAFPRTWHVVRWALLGLAVFFVGGLWALATSLDVLHVAKNAESQRSPPRLG